MFSVCCCASVSLFLLRLSVSASASVSVYVHVLVASCAAAAAASVSLPLRWLLILFASAPAFAFAFSLGLRSAVVASAASTPRLALCGRRQFIFGTLTAPCLRSLTLPAHCQLPSRSDSGWQACAFALKHTHVASSRPAVCACLRVFVRVRLCVSVCMCVSGISSISRFRDISTKGQREQQKLPLRSARCLWLSHVFHSHLQPFLLLTRFVPLLAFVSCLLYPFSQYSYCFVLPVTLFVIHSHLLFCSSALLSPNF